ncbi:MAG: hypothetical protein M0Z95_08955 [Actinomycetota bacterium]|jgi:hypothetical protein|nr:hypothetical protein [Actinomycetota bacterium]
MTAEVGPSVPVKELSAADLAEVAKRRWACAAPATWNRQVATIGSFAAFARARGWWGDGLWPVPAPGAPRPHPGHPDR